MTVAKQQRSTRATLHNLPALPQVLLKLLDVISQDSADIPQLANIIRQDSAITARLLTIANSSLYNPLRHCNTIERALMSLGLETVRTLILTAAFKQHFSHFDKHHYQFMQKYWRRSLCFAQSSQVLAKLTRYHPPAEAYLCGLLADVGQLCLLTEDPAGFLRIHQRTAEPEDADDQHQLERERNELSITHCEFGAELIESWKLDNFMSDAVRYHHEPAAHIKYAHHLVKIVNLANDFSKPDRLHGSIFQKAHDLFGLNEELVTELYQRIQADVTKMAQALDIEQDHEKIHAHLGARLGDINQVQMLTQPRLQPGNTSSAAMQSAPADPFAVAMLLGFGIERFVVFKYNSTNQMLEVFSDPGAETPAFQVSVADSNSLVVKAFSQDEVCDSSKSEAESLSILDQQLLRHCRQHHVVFMPWQAASNKGVVVAGVSAVMLEEQHRKSAYRRMLLNTAAQSLVTDKMPDETETRIRETIHEVSNPLSIINNYLEVLRLRFGTDSATDKELTILKEEIDRIGGILLRLKSPGTVTEEGKTDVNRIVEDQTRIFRESLCIPRGIQVNVQCDAELEPVYMDHAALKQVLTNLIKNAVEAMPDGGILTVTTQALVVVNGRPCAAVTIEDNGPGIDAHTMANLFEPTRSSKGNGHSGLGLSVVKRLMDSMKAQILCRSDVKGTQFKLLFPVHKERG